MARKSNLKVVPNYVAEELASFGNRLVVVRYMPGREQIEGIDTELTPDQALSKIAQNQKSGYSNLVFLSEDLEPVCQDAPLYMHWKAERYIKADRSFRLSSEFSNWALSGEKFSRKATK